jgi:hypothetical protein
MPTPKFILASLALLLFGITARTASAQADKSPYPNMATLDKYLIADQADEIALARTAAPPIISSGAEIMVLGHHGYTTAVKGVNGFTCLVERSWGNSTDNAGFWNPKMRAPHCFNAAAARSFARIYLLKTKLVLAAKSRTEIALAINHALDSKEIPAPGLGALAYMMSKQQYLNDDAKNWHPHIMFFIPNQTPASWGANLPGSPIIAVDDPEERVTIFMLLAGHWSDGSPAPMQ